VPQVVEGFDGRVVIGFAQRDAYDVDAPGQTQPHHFAEPPGMVATADGAFVLTLGNVGAPELLPRLEQVFTRGSGGFGGIRAGGDIVAREVDSVEGLDDFAPCDPTGDDVGGLDGIRRGRPGMWAIGPTAGRWRSGGEMGTLEHPLHGAPAGHGLRGAATPFLLDGTGSHRGKAQTRLTMPHQEVSQTYDTLLTLGQELIGMMERGAGRRAKAGPRTLVAIMHPFRDPAAAVVELSCDLCGRDASSIPFDGSSAKLGVFVIRSSGPGHSSPPKLR
jgi:hypothetical protein